MNKKRKVERVEREKELKLSMDEKLVKDYTTKMKKQKGYFLLEVGDVGTDLANPIEVALTLQPGREWFLALIIVVGILALVQAYISIPVRRKMLKHYEGIVNGDMLHIYAEAEYGKKKDGERTVGEDNLKLKLDSVTLELTLEELNEKTVRIEAIPALVVFTIKLLAFGPNELTWTSVVSGIFSGVMLGRKTSGGAKKEELIAQKRELEEELEKLGGGGRVSMHGSMKAVESVFGAEAARAVEGEIEGGLEGGEEGGDVEMAGLETRQAELPGSLGGGEEEEEEGGSLRAQLEQALREKEALRAKADKADAEAHTMQRETEGLRQRNVNDEGYPASFALSACAGLLNRGTPSVYSMYRDNDRDWLQRVYNFTWNADDYPFTAAPDFLNSCLTASGVDGYILYSYSAQQALVPMIATAAGVLNAVPLDVDTQLGLLEGVPAALVMDFTEEWGGFSPLDATRYCYEKYIGETTGMAKQNPGYAYPHNENLPDKLPIPDFNGVLIGQPEVGLVDFIVQRKLFNFYMPKNCVPYTDENALMTEIMANNPWAQPVAVYGYDDTAPIAGGDTYEAETTCVKQHNLGQVGSKGVNNLPWWSQEDTFDVPEVLPSVSDPENEVFDPTKKYIAIIMGDGDNLAYQKDNL
ncbi:hypothetical protein TeGR_g5492 [Tetraparma gracilis]|uniref:Uncharacterized protein n=1 Tax=Tetraparma gracilis TaxID=2962635 RepID=A0ABQ6MF92_9STRA|nr:hypothetical protein TeGR_g5492 [Tetraparma gracilis]